MTPIRVEIVEHSPHRSYSGIGRYALEIIRHLHCEAELAVTIRHNVLPPFSQKFSTLSNFPLAVKDHRPGNIVHFMQIAGCSQMLWNPVHPSFATVHDLGVLTCESDRPLFANPIDRTVIGLQYRGLKRVDELIADSDFTKQQLIETLKFPEDRIHVIHLGIDHQCFHPIESARDTLATRYDLHSEAHTFDLLYVGSELPRKNLSVLLQALAILKRNQVSVRLIKVGGSGGSIWRSQFAQEIERLNLTPDVWLIGTVPDEDLPLFYSAADLFVTTSLLEGFGLPALEAMACGLPVICSNAGSLPEITDGAALLVDPHDPEGVAATVTSLLHDSIQRKHMRKLGIRRAESFSWESAARQLTHIYKERMGTV